MITARFLIVVTALLAGFLMIKYPTVEANLRINGAVALVNPLLMTFINVAGITGMAGRIPLYKLAFIITGALLIVLGTVNITRPAKAAAVKDSGLGCAKPESKGGINDE
jgi:hypothetical protein